MSTGSLDCSTSDWKLEVVTSVNEAWGVVPCSQKARPKLRTAAARTTAHPLRTFIRIGLRNDPKTLLRSPSWNVSSAVSATSAAATRASVSIVIVDSLYGLGAYLPVPLEPLPPVPWPELAGEVGAEPVEPVAPVEFALPAPVVAPVLPVPAGEEGADCWGGLSPLLTNVSRSVSLSMPTCAAASVNVPADIR